MEELHEDAKAGKRSDDALLDIEVEVAVSAAQRSLPLLDILDLQEGQLIEFSDRADGPLTITTNGTELGSGYAVDVGERLGVEIETIDRHAAEP